VVVDIGPRALVIDVGNGWQAARTCIGGPQMCGVPHVCGGSSVYVWRATTDGDHDYASRSEPGLSAPVALPSSRGECHTCAPCGIRFDGRKWRSNFATHTNMFISDNDPSTSAHRRQARPLATSSPALFSLCAVVPPALTFYLPPKFAIFPLHALIVWVLPFPHWQYMTGLVAPVRRTIDHAPSEQLSPLPPCL
jgi:hypothetical protein